MAMKLIEAARQREKGQILRWAHYFEAYDFHFSSLKPKKLLEIGVMGGGSLWMWKKYFPDAEIIGVDIDPKCMQWSGDGVNVFIGDQRDSEFLSALSKFGPFDIIIDDGSHKMDDQQASFTWLFYLLPNALNDNGVYVIEDLHTSFWPPWGGGESWSTLNLLKNYVDLLHGWAIRSNEALCFKKKFGLSPLESVMSSIHFYDSICFIYKNGHGQNKLGEGGQWHG